MSSAISLRHVVKNYQRGKEEVAVLHGLDLAIAEGEFVAMIDVIVHGQSATLALQQVGKQADSIGPAIGIERAVIDRLDDLGEGLKGNV